MAQQLGLGVMPWSPLRNGFLSGKFSRKRTGPVDALRTTLVGEPTQADYDVIDVLETVAAEAGITPAATALSWVHNRPGVTSTLIGGRRLDQLKTNLDAIDVHLTQAQTETLDKASAPRLNFPAEYVPLSVNLGFAGATVDGVPSEMTPMLQHSSVRY
jgi:aryl-alcohol dehydrogenase-like predicted oxidoreductase